MPLGERVGTVLFSILAMLAGTLFLRRRSSMAEGIARSAASAVSARHADKVLRQQRRSAAAALWLFGVLFIAAGVWVAWSGLRG